MIANKIINYCGSSFVADFEILGLENFILKIKSYLIVNQLFGLSDIRYQIYRDDFKIDIKKQYTLLLDIEKAVEFSIDWMLKHLRKKQIDSKLILDYKSSLKQLIDGFDDSRIKKIVGRDDIDRFFSLIDYLKFTVAAIDIEEKSVYSFEDVAKLFYIVIDELNIIYLMNTINSIDSSNEWEMRLKDGLLEIVNIVVTTIVKNILDFKRNAESIEDSFKNYLSESRVNLSNNIILIDKLKKDSDINLIKISAVITSLYASIES
jgi:glutamate dehydrogenase